MREKSIGLESEDPDEGGRSMVYVVMERCGILVKQTESSDISTKRILSYLGTYLENLMRSCT